MKNSAKMDLCWGFSDPKSSMGNLCKTCGKDSWLCSNNSFTNSSTDSLFVWKGRPMFCFALQLFIKTSDTFCFLPLMFMKRRGKLKKFFFLLWMRGWHIRCRSFCRCIIIMQVGSRHLSNCLVFTTSRLIPGLLGLI